MIYQIFSFVLDIAVGLVAGAALLRAFMQWHRAGFANPLGRFVLALSDWIVLPMRRFVPAIGRLDTSSVLAAFLLLLAQHAILGALSGVAVALLGWLPVLAVLSLVKMIVSGLTMLVLVYAILSWVQAPSPLSAVLERLCQPLLRPIQRLLPLIGGVDLSPLVLLVLLQIASMMLGQLRL